MWSNILVHMKYISYGIRGALVRCFFSVTLDRKEMDDTNSSESERSFIEQIFNTLYHSSFSTTL